MKADSLARTVRAWLLRMYGDRHYGRWLRLRHFERVIRQLPVDLHAARILDAGCGAGAAALWLTDAYPASQVLGIDVDRKEIEALQGEATRHPNAQFEVRSVEDLPFDSNFDFIYSIHVLESVPADERAVCGFARALRPGGLLLLDVIEPQLGFSRNFGMRRFMHTESIPAGLVRHGYTLDDVKVLLATAGLEPIGFRYTMGRTALFAHTVFEFLRAEHMRLYIAILPLLRLAGYLDIYRPPRRGASLMVWARRPAGAIDASPAAIGQNTKI